MQGPTENVLITGGTFTSIESGYNGFRELQKYVAHSAFHDSGKRFNPPKCHPDTRITVLQRLTDWIIAKKDLKDSIMWLHGGLGVGKTAIAQTLAERCEKQKLLLACFFFSRSDTKRNHPEFLFPTIAYQIACSIPRFRSILESIIFHDPLIFTRSLETQATCLVIRPLQLLRGSASFEKHLDIPHLIIIDALDECGDEKVQSMLLELIAHVLQAPRILLKFLISSRPNPVIFHNFHSCPLLDLHISLSLNHTLRADEDIRKFLEDSFARIKVKHPLKQSIPELWPPQNSIRFLVDNSCGQFIYAAIAMRYISSIYQNPTHGLDVILGLRYLQDSMPFSELDTLYLDILASSRYTEKALLLIASVILRPNFAEVQLMQKYLCLEEGEIDMALADFGSVLSIQGPPERRTIHIMYPSFCDFLLDASRSKEYHLNVQHLHTKFAIASIESSQDHIHELQHIRESEIFTHLTLALPSNELRTAILRSPAPMSEFLKDLDDVEWSNSVPSFRKALAYYIGSFLPRYMKLIRHIGFEDVEYIYAEVLCSFDNLMVRVMDSNKDSCTNYSTLFMALLVLWEEFSPRLDDRQLTSLYWSLRSPSTTPILVDICYAAIKCKNYKPLCSFLEDHKRSGNYVMTDKKNTAAAVYCLGTLLVHHSREGYLMPTDRWYTKLPDKGHEKIIYGCSHSSIRWCNLLMDALPTLLHKAGQSEELRQLIHRSIEDDSFKKVENSEKALVAMVTYMARGQETLKQEENDNSSSILKWVRKWGSFAGWSETASCVTSSNSEPG